MNCPYCGYDRIQPNFNFCPKCKRALNEQVNNIQRPQTPQNSPISQPASNPQEKSWLYRTLSGWTYNKAMNEFYKYFEWAQKNPNDHMKFMEKWRNEGYDVKRLEDAIESERNRRMQYPGADRTSSFDEVVDNVQQSFREPANNTFVNAVNASPTTDAASIVRNKAIWKLQVGELARHIAPDEWQYVAEHLSGIVIEEGTSALIYVDGEQVAHMGSGMYVFDDKHALAAKEEANTRVNEEKGFFTRLKDNLYRFFTGRKREESTAERNARRRRVEEIMARMKKDTIIDVYLKSDRVFPAIFGQQHLSDSPRGYAPYIIQSRYLDVKVGVSMQLQIADFKTFIANHMAGYKTVHISDIVKKADSAVYSTLKFQLRDIEISERGLDEYTFNTIKNNLIRNLPNVLYGINVVQVLDIATTNEQLARFRQVEEQLYCTEREYDFLVRTNEFKNRIAAEENDQKIREARSEQELRVRLDELNKDKLLHEDEMEQFVALLMNQKIIREATNEADLDSAMMQIQRSRLVTREEFDIFMEDMNNRRFERSQVSEQLRAKSLMATALAKLEIDKTLNIANIQNAEAISEAEFEAFKKAKGREADGWDLETTIYGRQYIYENQVLLGKQDLKRKENEFAEEEAVHDNTIGSIKNQGRKQDYEFEGGKKLYEHGVRANIRDDNYEYDQRKEKDKLGLKAEENKIELDKKEREKDIDFTAQERDLSIAERMSNLAMKNMQAMQTAELERQKAQLEHEEKVTSIAAEVEKTKITTEKEMDADQLMAKNVSQMDAAAQAKFAESFSHLTEAELLKQSAEQQKELYEKLVKMAESNGVNIGNIHTANAKQQYDTMTAMMQAFKEMNISATGGQQNVVNSMLGVMQNFANTRINDVNAMKEEYRGQMHHEQGRVDENQRQSLNYTTKVTMSENMPPFTAGGTSVNVNVGKQYTCPRCGQPLDDTMSCCPNCGMEL